MINIKTIEDFESKVLNSNRLVVVDFFAVWCGPCKMLSPIIENICEEYKDICDVYKVDTNDIPELNEKYKIMMVPTILFFKDGKVIETIIGAATKNEIEEMILKNK